MCLISNDIIIEGNTHESIHLNERYTPNPMIHVWFVYEVSYFIVEVNLYVSKRKKSGEIDENSFKITYATTAQQIEIYIQFSIENL